MCSKQLAFIVILICICVASTAFAATAQQSGELITVEVEGFAPIREGAKNEAREAAKRSAYQAALEKALGAYVQGITELENYQLVKDKVFSQTQGIVKGLDIVSEKVDEDGVLVITAVCKVSVAALDGVLGPVTLDALGNPRVMVLIDERIGDKTSFLSVTEGEVLRVFEKAGYVIVDPSQSGLLKDIDLDAARISGSPEELRNIARTFNADVIITGKAYGSSFAQQKISGVNIHGVRTTVQLRAVLSNTAQQLGSDTFEEKTKGTSTEDGSVKGFKTAADKAAKSLVHKVAYTMISGTAGGVGGRTVKIRIADIDFKDAKTVREMLQELGKDVNVYQRAYRNKNLEIDVVSGKTADDLASILSDYGIDIEDMTGATVEGRFVRD